MLLLIISNYFIFITSKYILFSVMNIYSLSFKLMTSILPVREQ